MRREGRTFQEISDTLALSGPSHASKDYHAALRTITAPDAEALRAEAGERYQFLYEQATRTVLNPPLVHSAIGKVVPHPTRPGEYLINESVRNSAIDQCRKLTTDYLRNVGIPPWQAADPATTAMVAEAMSWVEELVRERDQLRADLADAHTQLAGWESGRITDAELVPAANVVNGDGPHPPAAYK